MKSLTQLTEADYEKMAQEIEEISKTESEESLYESIGKALRYSGLEVSTDDSFEILRPKALYEPDGIISIKKSFSLVKDDTTAVTQSEDEEEGRTFWDKFKDNLRSVICNDPKIKPLLHSVGTLKEIIKNALPYILTVLGIGLFLTPLASIIVSTVLALILKAGFQAYCQID